MELPAFEDPRVPFAAERTLLAWVRTGLAMMGFGFVVARFGLFLHEVAAARGGTDPPPAGPSLWLGTALVALGVAVNLLAAVRHVRLLRQLSGGGAYRPAVWSLAVAVTLILAVLGSVMVGYLLTNGI